MDWDDVRYFLELARSGSLSGASRSQGVEHTTIARRVSALEKALDVRLFDRLPRGWRLTSEGQALLPRAEALEGDVKAFKRQALGAAGLAGSVRLSLPPVMATHFIVPHLIAFKAQQPEVCVDLSADRRGANLLRGEADLALRVGPVDVPPGLIVRQLGSVGYGLYATAELLARPSKQQVFAGFDDSMSGSAQKLWLEQYAGERPFSFRSNDLATLFQLAKYGLGIALLPHLMVTSADGLQWLRTSGPVFERPLSLVLHPDLRRSARVRSVVQFLSKLMRTQEAQLREPSVSAGTGRK